jgi:hypothetical protein
MPIVIAGLDPAIYLNELICFVRLDAWVKPAHDKLYW